MHMACIHNQNYYFKQKGEICKESGLKPHTLKDLKESEHQLRVIQSLEMSFNLLTIDAKLLLIHIKGNTVI